LDESPKTGEENRPSTELYIIIGMATENKFLSQDKVRQIFFLIILVLLGALLCFELANFLPALLGAITLYVICRRWMYILVFKRKWKKGRAATVLMIVTFLVIMCPIYILISMMTSKIAYAIEHSNELIASINKLISNIESRYNITITSPENIDKLGGFIAQAIPNILNATLGTLVTIFFMYFILYFMLVNGKKMENSLYEYVPLKDSNVDRLGREMKNMVYANAIGIPVIAFLQGIVAIIAYFILGVKEPWFWFVVTCISAMLPVIGAAFAFVPIAIIFFANDEVWKGIVMLIYGFGVIGTVDNIFRFTIAKKIGNVHPLITIFGVLLGLKLFGFVGLIFGPLVISLFILLVEIYSSEFIVKQREATK
jgi:predicted PurR-regulated permease PerM